MIQARVPTVSGGGVAFSDAADGDIRGSEAERTAFAKRLGITDRWATVEQVHGSRVVEVDVPGDHGQADAMFTSSPGLPLAIFTADCAGVAIHAPGALGLVHAGWRGVARGVVSALVTEMRGAGFEPAMAQIGPSIGPCCFEVGPEVSGQFGEFIATTSWGSTSINLEEAIKEQLDGLEVWSMGTCTMHEPAWLSFRRDRTMGRMATVAWM
jgi:purine-nucleoside/S-methyl-5'-thioadenosine phosphorylase / adenosine deaminase